MRKKDIFLGILCTVTLCVHPLQHALGQVKDTNVVVMQESFDNGIRYVAHVKNATEVTIDFQCQSYDNAVPSCPLPASVSVTRTGTTEIFRFTQATQGKKWSVGSWKNDWCYGVPSRLKTDENYIYELPFERGKQCVVYQSYRGKHSHSEGSSSEFAIDFAMPEGTLVCAARTGTIVAIREDAIAGGAEKEQFEGSANVVVVRHDDGTYAKYVHLQPKSALVRLGQKVASGTPLARSGQTGWITSPHLHFDVFRVISGKSQVTLPVRFRTSEGIKERLYEGESYSR